MQEKSNEDKAHHCPKRSEKKAHAQMKKSTAEGW